MYELIIIVHFVFILWVVLGGFVVLLRLGFVWLHLPALIWGIVVEWNGWICPLTPLENFYRAQRGVAQYRGGFIEHYIVPIIYPEGLTRSHQVIMAVALLLLNIVIYIFVIRKYRLIHK